MYKPTCICTYGASEFTNIYVLATCTCIVFMVAHSWCACCYALLCSLLDDDHSTDVIEGKLMPVMAALHN